MGLRIDQDENKLQAVLDEAKGKPGLKLTRKKLKKAIQHLVSLIRRRDVYVVFTAAGLVQHSATTAARNHTER